MTKEEEQNNEDVDGGGKRTRSANTDDEYTELWLNRIWCLEAVKGYRGQHRDNKNRLKCD